DDVRLLRGRTRLLLRRHGAGLDLFQDAQPLLAIGLVVEVGRQVFEVEAAFRLEAAVARLTVFREEGGRRTFGRSRLRDDGVAGGEEERRSEQREEPKAHGDLRGLKAGD